MAQTLETNRLLALIAEEDPKNPLTDQELAEMLSVSRSNITTLRTGAGIENSRLRREPVLLAAIRDILMQKPDANLNYITKLLGNAGFCITFNSVMRYMEHAGLLPQAKEPSPLPVGARKKIAQPLSGQDAFSSIIGSTRSLHLQIKQAKAAVLYPPNGLHTLIVGETGVGKSALAEAMYNFALISKGISSDEMPFVVFNCADYTENPQLLTAQLFGYQKGAFTGASEDREGLISKADGGIFFLDEVHRMPPDGQEMLFQLIDKGVYRRLGDSRTRKAQVMIVAATTEDIGTSLLDAFRRRIPMVISVPSLDERRIDEKYDIIAAFFHQEAMRINRSLLVKSDALRRLLPTHFTGNVGELRGKIQVACAKGFLSRVHQSDQEGPVVVDMDSLDLEGYMRVSDMDAKAIDRLTVHDLLVRPTDDGRTVPGIHIYDPYSLPDEIYRTIESEYAKLRDTGTSRQEIDMVIWSLIENKIARYVRELQVDKNLLRSESLHTIVDEDIAGMVREMLKLAEEELGEVDDSLLFCLVTHFNATIRRLREGKRIINPNLDNVKVQYAREFKVASRMATLSYKHLGLELPDEEIGFIAMYLAATNPHKRKSEDTISIIVVTHGRIAEEMAAVADRFMGLRCVTPVNIDLDESPQHVYRRLKDCVIACHRGRGVLILVDMGSPESFGAQIARETGIEIRTVTRVDTLMMLDAVRKVQIPNADIDEVAASLAESRNSMVLGGNTGAFGKGTIFLCYCLTGQGCASFMLDRLMDLILAIDTDIEFELVSALDDVDIEQQIRRLKRKCNIIGAAGSFKVEIPGMPLLLMNEINLPDAVSRFLAQVKRSYQRLQLELMQEERSLSLFGEEDLYPGWEAMDKEEVIRFMAGRLEERGYVTSSFVEGALQREEILPTIMANGVAIPHGYSSDVNHSRIGLMVPKTPVPWGNGQSARLVLLLAFTEESSGAFKRVYNLITDEETVEHIIRSKGTEDIMRCLGYGSAWRTEGSMQHGPGK